MHETTIWTDAERAPLVSSILEVMGELIGPIGIGGPRTAEVDDLARFLNCPREDDLRKLAVERPAAFMLLAARQPILPEELAIITDQATTVLTIEPLAADFAESNTIEGVLHNTNWDQCLIQIPAFQQSPGFLAAFESNDLLGHEYLLNFDSCGRRECGSLFARLFDAWQAVLKLTDLPDQIDASVTGPFTTPPDDLCQLSGRMAVHARFAGDCAAVLTISDQSFVTRRHLHVVGTEAELCIDDWCCEMQLLDDSVEDRVEQTSADSAFVDLIGAQWRRLLDRPAGTHNQNPPDHHALALACCLTCLLSTRTGQPESPRNLLAMNR